jgi:hypothetical protein
MLWIIAVFFSIVGIISLLCAVFSSYDWEDREENVTVFLISVIIVWFSLMIQFEGVL